MHQQLPVHRAIMVVDVERFGDRSRTNLNQLAIRDGLYKALTRVFRTSGIAWANCISEDRGDGVLILIPPEVPKTHLVTSLPAGLAEALSPAQRGVPSAGADAIAGGVACGGDLPGRARGCRRCDQPHVPIGRGPSVEVRP